MNLLSLLYLSIEKVSFTDEFLLIISLKYSFIFICLFADFIFGLISLFSFLTSW